MSPRRNIPISDPGLQPERTTLSWTRTSLAMLVCSATLLRWSWHYPAVVFIAIALLTVLAIFIVFTQRSRYAREARSLANERMEPNYVSVIAMTLGMGALGGIGLYLVGVAL